MNRLLVAAAGICLLFSLSVRAQSVAPDSPTTAPQEISPEKRALAKELSEVMGLKKQGKDLLTTVETEMSKEMLELTWTSLSAMPEMKALTQAEQDDLQRQMRENADKVNAQMIDAINRKIDYGQMLEDVSTVVYAKYFNETQLKDLIAFYQSDTGKRNLEVMPQLMADSMSEASRRLTPVLNDIVRDIADADTKKYRDQVTAMAKAHHRQTP